MFSGPPARADPEVEAPIRDDVDRCSILGSANWIMQRHEQDVGAHSNSAGARRDSCEDWELRRRPGALREVMFAGPHMREAQLLAPHRTVDVGFVHFIIRPAKL